MSKTIASIMGWMLVLLIATVSIEVIEEIIGDVEVTVTVASIDYTVQLN